MKPIRIEQISTDILTIEWDDAHHSFYFLKDLRAKCPCAVCREEREKPVSINPLRVLNENPNDFELVRWEPVGRYAISLHWSDGHDTGIYTFEFLRGLCQCDLCTSQSNAR